MNSPLSGRHSDRATPSLRDAPTTEHYDSNRQRLHLSNAETCPDEPGQLCDAHNIALLLSVWRNVAKTVSVQPLAKKTRN